MKAVDLHLRGTRTRMLKFLFLSSSGNEEDGSRVYRCDYQGRQLARFGHEVRVEHFAKAGASEIQEADVVVFARCHFNEKTLRLARFARQLGKVLCGDIDDKAYSPWHTFETGHLRSQELVGKAAEVLQGTRKAHGNVLRLLPLVDAVTVSTPAIKRELESLGFRAHVSRNAVDDEARRPLQLARRGLTRILFMTGTRTHDADFRLIAPVLRHFLSHSPDVELTLLGPMLVPPVLSGLQNVRVMGRVRLGELQATIAGFDLGLIPLENTRFNNCKSELKFVEYGLSSVPVIASPREAYVDAIVDGQNGFLAERPTEWLSILGRLKEHPDLLSRVALAAHETVMDRYTVSSRGNQLAKYYQDLVSELST